MSVVRANETRGTGPTWDHWPAELPFVAYVTADGAFLCVACANGGNGSRATELLDVADRNDDQWRVIGAQINADPTPCAHCDRTIPGKADARTWLDERGA